MAASSVGVKFTEYVPTGADDQLNRPAELSVKPDGSDPAGAFETDSRASEFSVSNWTDPVVPAVKVDGEPSMLSRSAAPAMPLTEPLSEDCQNVSPGPGRQNGGAGDAVVSDPERVAGEGRGVAGAGAATSSGWSRRSCSGRSACSRRR